MKKGVLTVLLAAVVGGMTAFAVVRTVGSEGQPLSNNVSDNPSAFRTVSLSQDDYPDFTYAAESAVDAVVYVKVTGSVQSKGAPSSLFEYFFGYPGEPQQREMVGSGSGVIIRNDGYIVTNNHVIENASKIEVTLNNNQTYEAKLIGTDPATDVALIKIEADGLPVVPLGDSDALRLGEWVIAIGSPYDLRSTITAGIVSAKGRSMPNYTGEFKIESFIQTDAAVNPGNSGGALVNKSGELVGINTAIYSQTGSYAGYSFAVPVNIVKRIVGDLLDYGSVKRAMLGISMQSLDNKKVEELKLSSANGVYIAEVSKGGAADEAGIKAGDVLVAVGSVKVKDASAVQEAINSYHPGDKTEITVIRNSKEMTFEVTLKSAAVETGTVDEEGAVAFYGAKLKEASKEQLAKLGLKNGVEIVSVGEGKVAEQGVAPGFIILYVNNTPVSKPQDVLDIAKKSKRAVFVEGVTPYGKSAYFGFGM